MMVGVRVIVGVCVAVGVRVGVEVAVWVGVRVGVRVGVLVGVGAASSNDGELHPMIAMTAANKARADRETLRSLDEFPPTRILIRSPIIIRILGTLSVAGKARGNQCSEHRETDVPRTTNVWARLDGAVLYRGRGCRGHVEARQFPVFRAKTSRGKAPR